MIKFLKKISKTTGHQLETVCSNKLLCIKTCRVHLIFCMSYILHSLQCPYICNILHLSLFYIFFFSFTTGECQVFVLHHNLTTTTTTNIINTFLKNKNRRCASNGSKVYFYRIGSMYDKNYKENLCCYVTRKFFNRYISHISTAV